MDTNQTTKPVFVRILTGSLTAGAVAAVLNNAYCLIHSDIGLSNTINYKTVTFGSLVPALVAGICYYILSRFTANATRIFIVTVLILTALSITKTMVSVLPDGTEVPEGFTGLTLPMHLAAGLSIAFIIPRFVRNKD